MEINVLEYEKTNDIPIEFKKIKTDSIPDLFVCSYNILADSWVKKPLLSNLDEIAYDINFRKEKIVKEVINLDADIVCFQECDYSNIKYFQSKFEENGYKLIYQPDRLMMQVTNSIIYKSDKFLIELEKFIDLNDLKTYDPCFEVDKECIILKMKDLRSNKEFILANTHIYWNPNAEFIKFGQISYIISKIDQEFKEIPFILCGDFNSFPNSNAIRYLYKKKPIYEGILFNKKKAIKFFKLFDKNFKFSTDLRSAYDEYKKGEDLNETHPHFTNLTFNFRANLDYIIYTPLKLEVTEVLVIPYELDFEKTFLPNRKYPSDHLKIAAKLKFI